MAMNFFDHQDVARKKTQWLVYAYTLTLVLIVSAVHLVVIAGLNLSMKGDSIQLATDSWFDVGMNLRVLAIVAPTVLLAVFIGSAVKKRELRGGGAVIAEWLGGRQIYHGSKDPIDRKVWNVVEEMAIASGTPVPAVYLLDDESGINAFAAGVTVDTAVIGVTLGCAKELSRDELQGVIAHEFSHISHGDMRLNMKLIGTLAGITLLTHIGYLMLRSLGGGSSSRRRRSSGKDEGGGAVVFIAAVGVGLYLIGIIGALAASLIQAAISRQREFLADASAVQYTRNPLGIAGALRAIGNLPRGSKLDSSQAGEVRHMFFSQGLSTAFATHPPLDLRIGRIEEGWKATTSGKSSGGSSAIAGMAGFASGSVRGAGSEGAPDAGDAATGGDVSLLSSIGDPGEGHVAYAHELLSQIPTELREAVDECFSARCVIYGLLLSKESELRKSQLTELSNLTDPTSVKTCRKILPELDSLSDQLRVPLLDIATGVLKEMTSGQYTTFRATVVALIKADDRLELFEWLVKRSLLTSLDVYMGIKAAPAGANRKLVSGKKDVALLLSTMAHAGHDDSEEASSSYASAIKHLPGTGYRMLDRKACTLTQLDQAMERLAALRPREKEVLLRACVKSIAADGHVSQMEAELLRVFSEMLGCPVPPLLPGQSFVA